MSNTLEVPGRPSGLPTQPRTASPAHSFQMDDSAVLNDRASLHSYNTEQHNAAERAAAIKGVARHTFGLILLCCVVLLWTTSNFLGSSIFADDSYAKPFFLTYLSTSMFLVVMLPRLFKTAYTQYKNGTLRSTTRSLFSRQTLNEFLGRDVMKFNNAEGEAFLEPEDNDGVLPISGAINASSKTAMGTEYDGYLSVVQTARMALIFCTLWFGANYFTMACLQYTTVASTTILTSTSSVWTLLIGTLSGTEKFTWRKLCGVLGSIFGIILISRLDLSSGDTDEFDDHAPNNERDLTISNFKFNAMISTTKYLAKRAIDEFPTKTVAQIALGDAMALLSAIIYGFYTIVLKQTTLKAYPLELHMPTFFGLVGLWNIILLSPLFPIFHLTGYETFAWPPTATIWWIIIGNGLASLFSDILWAYAMIFTSPLVVTVGLSLNIPLSLIGEMIIQGRYEGWMYWIGAMVVVGSFVFVEREEVKEEKEIAEEYTGSMKGSTVLARSGLLSEAPSARGPSVEYTGSDERDFVNVENSGRGRGRHRSSASDDLHGLLFDDATATIEEEEHRAGHSTVSTDSNTRLRQDLDG